MSTSKILNSTTFKSILLFVALIYSFSFTQWFLWKDTFYWVNISPYYYNDWMQGLFLFFCNGLRNILGLHIVYYNIVAWLLCIASITMMYISFQKSTDLLLNLNYLSIGIILLGPGTQNMLNPDTLSLFIGSIILLLVTKHNNNICWIITAILVAMLSAVRFPNILIIFLIIPFYIINNRNNDKLLWLKVVLFMVIFAAIYLLIIKLLYHPCNSFDPIDNSHNIPALLIIYLKALLFAVAIILFTICAILILKRTERHISNKTVLYIAFGIIYTLCLIFFDYKLPEVYGIKPMIAYFVLFLIISLIWETKNFKQTLFYWLILFYGFIFTAGSDCGFLKIFPFYATIFPVVIIKSKHLLTHYSIIILSCIIICSIASQIIIIRDRGYNCYSDFENITLWNSTEWVQKDHELVDVVTSNTSEDNIFFGGRRIQQLYIATGTTPPYKISFAQNIEDKNEINTIINYFQNNRNCTVFNIEYSSVMENEMNKLGFTPIKLSDGVTMYKH